MITIINITIFFNVFVIYTYHVYANVSGSGLTLHINTGQKSELNCEFECSVDASVLVVDGWLQFFNE